MSNYADAATPTAKLVVAEASRSYVAVPGCPTGTQSPVVLLYDGGGSFSYSTAAMFWRPRQAAKEKREGEEGGRNRGPRIAYRRRKVPMSRGFRAGRYAMPRTKLGRAVESDHPDMRAPDGSGSESSCATSVADGTGPLVGAGLLLGRAKDKASRPVSQIWPIRVLQTFLFFSL